MKLRSNSTFWLQLLTFLGLSILISFGMHSHMDEYLHFGTLEYLNANFYLNKFTLGVDSYHKLFPGGLKFPIAFYYTGCLQGILFYPFYLLFPLEMAKFLYALTSLGILFIFMIKSFRLRGTKRWIALLFLPIYITMLHDGGPVNVGLISFFVSKYLIEKWMQDVTLGKRVLIGFLLASTWILAFFDKQFYLYLFPSVCLFSMANLSFCQLMTKRGFSLILPVGIFFLFILFYFFTETAIIPYENGSTSVVRAKTLQIIGGTSDLKDVLRYLRHFPNYATETIKPFLEDRTLALQTWMGSFDFSFYALRNLSPAYYFTFPFAFILCILFFVQLFKNEKLGSTWAPKTWWYLGSWVTLVFIFMVLGKVRFSHHYIYLWIPFLGLLLDNESKWYRLKTFQVFLGINLVLGLFNLIFSPPNKHLLDSYQSVAKFTQRENKELIIVNFDSWDYVMLRKLDNPNQHIVTNVDPTDSIQFKRLVKLADSLKTPIIEVTNRFDLRKSYQENVLEQKLKAIHAAGYSSKKLNTSENVEVYLIKRAQL